jgi:hypothetical protein
MSTVKLQAEQSYQRARINARKVAKMASTWKWQACDPILVSHRGNGTYRIVEGNHRVRALLLNHEPEAPCRIVEDLTEPEEADLYYTLNVEKDKLSVADAWTARVVRGDSEAVSLQRLLTKLGLEPGRARTGRTVTFMSRLIRLYEKDEKLATRIMEIIADLTDGHENYVGAHIFTGILHLHTLTESQNGGVGILDDPKLEAVIAGWHLEALLERIQEQADQLGCKVHHRIAATRGIQEYLNDNLSAADQLNVVID